KFEARLQSMGIADPNRTYSERDLAPGPDILFAASGVTDGNLLHGVRFFAHGCRTTSLVMALREHIIRFVETVHLDGSPDVVVEFWPGQADGASLASKSRKVPGEAFKGRPLTPSFDRLGFRRFRHGWGRRQIGGVSPVTPRESSVEIWRSDIPSAPRNHTFF